MVAVAIAKQKKSNWHCSVRMGALVGYPLPVCVCWSGPFNQITIRALHTHTHTYTYTHIHIYTHIRPGFDARRPDRLINLEGRLPLNVHQFSAIDRFDSIDHVAFNALIDPINSHKPHKPGAPHGTPRPLLLQLSASGSKIEGSGGRMNESSHQSDPNPKLFRLLF